MKKNKIISTPITRKEYKYELKGVHLSFVLRQDSTQELLYFKELLTQAMVDIEKDIKDFRK